MSGFGSDLSRLFLEPSGDGPQLLHPYKMRSAVVDADVLGETKGEEFAHQSAYTSSFQCGQHGNDLQPLGADSEVDLYCPMPLQLQQPRTRGRLFNLCLSGLFQVRILVLSSFSNVPQTPFLLAQVAQAGRARRLLLGCELQRP